MKMLKHRKFVYAFVERGDEIQRLDMIDEESLVIIITVRAREQLINALIDKIKEHHPKILILTMSQTYQHESVDWNIALKEQRVNIVNLHCREQ